MDSIYHLEAILLLPYSNKHIFFKYDSDVVDSAAAFNCNSFGFESFLAGYLKAMYTGEGPACEYI